MSFARIYSWLLLVILLSPGNVLASNTVLSGIFNGSETRIEPLSGTCGGTDLLGYQVTGTVQVSQSGSYSVVDAYNFIGVDISVLIYTGNFDPNSPEVNLLTSGGVDYSAIVELQADTNYVIVTQNWCENHEGAWAVTFTGPGTVTAAEVVQVPAMTDGVFSASDPVANTDCGNSGYQQTGPLQVSNSGTYYFSDISARLGVDMCLQVYSAPFSPSNPSDNRVGTALDDFGSLELNAGQDYYFVTQPFKSSETGEFFFVLAPPASFRVNRGLSGSWYYPPTSGQGFLLDVLDELNLLSLAWFTFDLQRPDESATALIGEPGHRWMTALGSFDGDTANVDIYWASGMIFDSADPPLNDEVRDGTMTIQFTSCIEGTLYYDLGSAMVSGIIPIQPVTYDSVELCKSLTSGPGKPGPL